MHNLFKLIDVKEPMMDKLVEAVAHQASKRDQLAEMQAKERKKYLLKEAGKGLGKYVCLFLFGLTMTVCSFVLLAKASKADKTAGIIFSLLLGLCCCIASCMNWFKLSGIRDARAELEE